MKEKHCNNGGLTLVPLTGFKNVALKLKQYIEAMSQEDGSSPEPDTRVDIADFSFDSHTQGEPRLELIKKHIGGHDCVILTSGPGTPKMLTELIMTLGNVEGHNARRIAVMSGYFPLSRSDKDERDKRGRITSFAAASLYMRQFICAANGKLDRFFSFDLHSDQLVNAAPPGIIKPFYLGKLILEKVLSDIDPKEKICLAFPDDGARKRYESAASRVHAAQREMPMVFVQKRRQSSAESKMLSIYGDLDALKDATVIGLDDEYASGKSSMDVARHVKKNYGARAYRAAVTHGILCTDGPAKLLNSDCPIDRLYITDTIPPHNRPELNDLISNGKIIIVPCEKDFAQVAYYHHWDRDIWEER